MTDSSVEKLLQQMSLKEPSRELDGIIEALPEGFTHTVARPSVVQSGFGFVVAMSIVAACSATMGFWVGESRHQKFSNQSTAGLTAGADLEAASSDGSHSDLMKTWDPEDYSTTVVTRMVDIPDKEVQEHLQGPVVGMLCSLGTDSSDFKKQRCLKCHEGVDAARHQFRDAHVHQLKATSCEVCHEPVSRDESDNHDQNSTSAFCRGPCVAIADMRNLNDKTCLKCHNVSLFTPQAPEKWHGHNAKQESCEKCHQQVGLKQPSEHDSFTDMETTRWKIAISSTEDHGPNLEPFEPVVRFAANIAATTPMTLRSPKSISADDQRNSQKHLPSVLRLRRNWRRIIAA